MTLPAWATNTDPLKVPFAVAASKTLANLPAGLSLAAVAVGTRLGSIVGLGVLVTVGAIGTAGATDVGTGRLAGEHALDVMNKSSAADNLSP